jgi:hypothetical protein
MPNISKNNKLGHTLGAHSIFVGDLVDVNKTSQMAEETGTLTGQIKGIVSRPRY